MSQWSASDLADFIKQRANSKNLLVQSPEGVITPELEQSIEAIAAGIANTHNTWQDAVRVGNCTATGGGAPPGGPIAGAIGQGPIGIFSESFTASDISDAIDAEFIPPDFTELTEEHQELNQMIGIGFAEAWNQWIDTTGIQNILVQQGTSSHTDKSPGTVSNAIGSTFALQGFLTQDIQFDIFTSKAAEAAGSLLTQSEEGVITPEVEQYIAAISEGLEDLQKIWLSDTTLEDQQHNGGVTTPGSGTIAAPTFGQNGILQ